MKCCLDDNYRTLLSLIEGDDSDHVLEISPTFLSSLSRQESVAPVVYRMSRNGHMIEFRSTTGNEKGRQMGFADAYLANALEDLYATLTRVHNVKFKREVQEMEKLEEYVKLCDDLRKIAIPPEFIKSGELQLKDGALSYVLKLKRLEGEERLDR